MCRGICSNTMKLNYQLLEWVLVDHPYPVYHALQPIATVVTITEILKNNGLAIEKSKIPDSCIWKLINFFKKNCAEITTSTVDVKDESRGRPIQKAKVKSLHFDIHSSTSLQLSVYCFEPRIQIEILLGKTEKFDELMAAAAEEREAGNGEEQN
ncbi:hypothetical protein BHM03_00011257 [Ensete ventricosum]|nr:hypothetical protein BHM03_00011257 [Ensete ventricosum]